MNLTRFKEACTVFKGKIIVAGGEHISCWRKLVEAYDYYKTNGLVSLYD